MKFHAESKNNVVFQLCLVHVFMYETPHFKKQFKDLANLVASCLNSRPPCELPRQLSNTSRDHVEIFLGTVRDVANWKSENTNRLCDPIDIKWVKEHPGLTKLYFLAYFYGTLNCPLHVNLRKRIVDFWRNYALVKTGVRDQLHCYDMNWKTVSPNPLDISPESVLNQIYIRLKKLPNQSVHPIVKCAFDRLQPSWPLGLLCLLPRRVEFISACLRLRSQIERYNSRFIVKSLAKLTRDEQIELKSIIACYRRRKQLLIFHDSYPVLKNTMDTFTIRQTCVVICKYCYCILVYADLRHRPPVRGFYIDEDSGTIFCGNCHSSRLIQFPLYNKTFKFTLRVSQPDLQSIGICKNALCIQLTSRTSGFCVACDKCGH